MPTAAFRTAARCAMSRIAGTAPVAVAIALIAAPPARAETLTQALARTVERNPEIRAAAASRAAAEAAVSQARGAFLPTIEATIGRGRETSDNASTRPLGDLTLNRSEAEVTLSQLVFDAGATSSQVRRSEARAEVASHQFANRAEAVAFRAVQAYLDVSRLRAQVDIAAESADAHRRTLKLVTLLAVGGAGRRSDALQAEARLAQAEAALHAFEGQYDQAAAEFRRVTGAPPGELERPAPAASKLPADLERALALAAEQHPALRAAALDLEAAQAERELSRARLGPRVNLEMGVAHNRDLDGVRGASAERIAMLRLRYNLFRGGADAARIREAQSRIDEAAAALEAVRGEVEREVRQAWQSLRAERLRLPQLASYARISAEVSEAYRAQFRLGLRSLLDVLNSEAEHFAARSAHVGGEMALLAAEHRILAGMGRLLVALGVEVSRGEASQEGEATGSGSTARDDDVTGGAARRETGADRGATKQKTQ